MSDLELVPGAMSRVVRQMSNGEMVFVVEHVPEVIQCCTSAGVAVLGIEVLPGLNVSIYERQFKDDPKEDGWTDYVRANNALAADFIRRNAASKTSDCVLMTASWREFLELKEFHRQLK